MSGRGPSATLKHFISVGSGSLDAADDTEVPDIDASEATESEDEGDPVDEEKLEELGKRFAEIEKGLTPKLREALEEECEAVTKALKDKDAEDAEQAIDELEESIPGAEAILQKQGRLAGAIGELQFPATATHVVANPLVDLLDVTADDDWQDVTEKIADFRRNVDEAFRDQCATVPKGRGVEIDGCWFHCSKPIFTLKGPVSAAVKSGMMPSDRSLAQSGFQLQGGVFGVYVAVTVTSGTGGGDPSGWSAGLLQNCNSNRVVEYSNGAKVSKVFGMVEDIPAHLVSLTPGAATPVSLTDGPKWQWCNSKTASIRSVAIDDSFSVYLMVEKSGAARCCLLRIDWSFTSDGKAGSYSIGQVSHLPGTDMGGALIGGPRANSMKEKFQAGS